MTPRPLHNFTVLESVYGPLIINRHCAYQPAHLVKTGLPHIHEELNQVLTIASTLPPQCVAVDAGANAGLVAIPLAHLLKDRGGVVHAFEVQRMMCYALCGSAALNDLDNLLVHHRGLGAARSTVTMAMPGYSIPQDLGLFSLIDEKPGYICKDERNVMETIEIVPLDELNLPRHDFLKIDVEGMEIDVLKGAGRTLRDHRPWCWIEYSNVKIEDIKSQFAGLQYKFYVMDPLNLLAVPTERLSGLTMSIHAKEV